MGWSDDPESRPGSDRQWWLTQGTEFCFICEFSVHPEMLSYCVACDRAICHFCLNATGPERELLCPYCAGTRGDG